MEIKVNLPLQQQPRARTVPQFQVIVNCFEGYVEIKCQLDATEVFIADLIACSTCFGHHYAHHQELKSIIQWLLRVVFCAVVFSSSWSGVELSNTLELLMMGIVMPETC